jgi:serine/threonine protein kinase
MPDKIGHYTIVGELGRGGMGIVYKAHEESLNRFVAIKVLTERLTEDDTFLQRFVREAQAAAGVSHPNIVQIFFIGEEEGHPYFVMEYVTGRSLNQILREEGRVDNPAASQMILQAAHGLAAAHDKGIIHRDIKPANLILDDRGIVKIADFGLALPADAETRLTATGMLVGTPGYLAPEQCRNEKPDHRTDIYALGITFYQLLTATTPFHGESPLALLKQILDTEPPDVGTLNPTVDDDTRHILGKMIAKDREQRYQDCHQLVADLEDYLAKKGVRSATTGLNTRRPSTANVAAAGAGAAAAVMAAAPVNSRQSTLQKTSPMASQDLPTTFVGDARQPELPSTQSGKKAPQQDVAAPIATSTEPRTNPEPPFRGPDTLVPPPAAAVVAAPPPPAARRSSSALVIALVLLVLAGGGVAATFLGLKMYRGWQAGHTIAATAPTTPSTNSASLATPVSDPNNAAVSSSVGKNPPPDVLLSQKLDSPDLGGGAAASTNNGSGRVGTGAGSTLGVSGQQMSSSNSRAGRIGAGGQQDPRRDRGTGRIGDGASGQTYEPNRGAAERRQGIPPNVERERRERPLSGIAVAVTGDPALLGAVTSVLTSEMESTGQKVVDAESLPAIEGLLRGNEPGAARLIHRLRTEGMATLLLARIDPAGQRELHYMGRSDTAYSARITLTTYDLATGTPIGTPGRATIEYTSATAEREAEKVVGRLARSSAEAIQNR